MKHLRKFESVDPIKNKISITEDIIDKIKNLLVSFESMGCNVYINNHDESAAKQLMKPGDKVFSINISKDFKTKKGGKYNQDIDEIKDFKEEELTFMERLGDLGIGFIYKENGYSKNDYYHVSKNFLIGDYHRYDK